MEDREAAELIFKETDSIIYIADIDTYELEYINDIGKKVHKIAPEDESYKGKKCYEILQGNKSPCEFCTNASLKCGEFQCSCIYNDMLHEYFHMRDKRICTDGKNLRLSFAEVATEQEKIRQQTEIKLKTKETLVQCIKTLAEHQEVQKAIHQMLQTVAEFYAGERAYLFEIDYEKGMLSNTYEWVQPGISPEIDRLQNLSINYIETWLKQFKEKGEFYISNLEEEASEHRAEYDILREQGIDSLIAAPLMSDQEIIGFIGVDNPRKNYSNLVLLTSVTYFVKDDLDKRKTTAVLHEMSYMDALTRVFNRNKYNRVIEELEVSMPTSLGVIYMDLNGLKMINDKFGHQCGDRFISHASEIMRKVFTDEIFRTGGDEFVIICRDADREYILKKEKELCRTMKEEDVNISIGSSWAAGGRTITELLSEAEERMYAEKQKYYEQSR